MIGNGKIPVSERGLLQRINRQLVELKTDQVVKKARFFAQPHLGAYYVLDTKAGCVVEYNINLEKLGKKLGVFHSYETLVKEVG